MIRNSIKNGCKNLCLYPKSFKIIFKPNSYLMSICRRGQVNPSTYTFCSIDVTRTMAYWCSQKEFPYYETIIRNLERVFKLFWNTIWSLCGWFIWVFLSSYSLEYNERGSKLFEFLVSPRTASGFWILQNIFTFQYLL